MRLRGKIQPYRAGIFSEYEDHKVVASDRRCDGCDPGRVQDNKGGAESWQEVGATMKQGSG